MSPIRMAPGLVHPRGPRPVEARRVRCPYCEQRFEISQRALVVRCPRCTSPLRFEDLVVRRQPPSEVTTMGHVTIAPSCAMNGRIVCGKFSNSGRFDGHATVHGRIELLSESMTTGELVGRSIAAPHGASFRGKMQILPNTARLEGAISVSPSRVVRTR